MNLSCPQCGLEVGMHGPRHEYCPRCIAERDQPVPLVASSLFKDDTREGEGEGAARPSDAGSLASKAANVAALMRGRHAF
jgi:hypothetical protein